MKKIIRAAVWVGVALILLGAVACNIDLWSPEGDGAATEPGVTHVPDNPAAPENTDGAETILIPWGTFWMGSETSDTNAGEDEFPRHQVTLDGFYIYTHEVTNSMYAECVAARACDPVNVLESGPTTHYADPAYAEFPVVGVDWNMADDYCTWAGGRLPNEAEWERASRGAESLLYPWGADAPTCDRVNMLGCAVPPDTVDVGSYLLGNSPEGVWDMSGNVWEWVHDWYGEDYYTFSPSHYPLGPYTYEDVSNPTKVVRGGGLFSDPTKMRSAERAGANLYRPYDDVGFRCVTPGGLAMPEGYVPPLDRHEMVDPDPDGGEHIDDPDEGPWIAIGFRNVSCPTTEGLIHLVVEIDSSEPGVTYMLTLEGTLFDCHYDDVLNVLACTGPVPANDDELTRYYFEIHPSLPGAVYMGYVDKPTDCELPPVDIFGVEADCPEDGLFAITFYHDPPVAWDITEINTPGGTIPITCSAVAPGETACLAPAIPIVDHYAFYLHGYSEDGTEYMWAPWVPIRDDCPVDFLDADLRTSCFEAMQSVEIMYMPEVMGIDTVTADGNLLDCTGMAPNVMICTPLPGAPGDSVDVTVCTDTMGCFTETLIVSGCPGVAEFPGFLIEPYCYPPEAPAQAISIHYWPFDEHLLSATIGDTTLSCTDWGGGWYVCPGAPGTPGDTVMVTFCLEDGRCDTGPMMVPDCGTTPEEEVIWRVAAIGCHDETHIYFIVDTGYEWLVPGAAYTYSAWDGETGYSCTVNPAVPGRIYCSGLRPTTPESLQLCIQQDGGELHCEYYDDFPIWVGGVPPCFVEEPEEEPHNACYDYTTAEVCDGEHKGECRWIYEDPPHCEPIP